MFPHAFKILPLKSAEEFSPCLFNINGVKRDYNGIKVLYNINVVKETTTEMGNLPEKTGKMKIFFPSTHKRKKMVNTGYLLVSTLKCYFNWHFAINCCHYI